jgi:hypothetical protein
VCACACVCVCKCKCVCKCVSEILCFGPRFSNSKDAVKFAKIKKSKFSRRETAICINCSIMLDVMPSSPVKVNRRLGEEHITSILDVEN